MKNPGEQFMRHFRWITPLLLGFTVFMLEQMYFDFQKLKEIVIQIRIEMAAERGNRARHAKENADQ